MMAALIPYFNRFTERFPNLQSLAEASEEDVLKAWAGLGYYSRARNLHKAAKLLSALPEIPRKYEEWLELPGVGPYTAAAVVSQCFDEPAAVWDGNVLRVLSRFLGRSDAHSNLFKQECVDKLNEFLESKPCRSSVFNQALMELGSQVCSANAAPSCMRCPLRDGCVAFQNDLTNELPPPKARRDSIELKPKVLLVLKNVKSEEHVLLVPRLKTHWFSGMWDFPSEIGGVKEPICQFNFQKTLKNTNPLKKIIRHQVTHHKFFIEASVLRVYDESEVAPSLQSQGKWVKLETLVEHPPLPLSTTAKKVLRQYLRDHEGLKEDAR